MPYRVPRTYQSTAAASTSKTSRTMLRSEVCGDVLPQSLEVPKHRIHAVVARGLAVFRKRVGKQALLREARKFVQHGSRYVGPARLQRQTGQRDHRVAPPFAEPGVTGHNRPSLASIRSATAHRKLRCRQHQLPNPVRSFEGGSRMRSDPIFEQPLVQVLARGERRAILEAAAWDRC